MTGDRYPICPGCVALGVPLGFGVIQSFAWSTSGFGAAFFT